VQESQPLRGQLSDEKINTCRVAARTREAGDKTKLDRIIADAKDDWNCPGCRFGRERRGSAARYGDHADLMADQTGRKLRQPIISTFRRAVFDGHILALDVTGFTKALPEWSQVHKVG
jgi:hypothetical protein